ncbi:MAG TPA: hypothetical protein VGL75_08075 [Acidothermaceae bacterium]
MGRRAWTGPASIPKPPGRRLPGWAKACFAVGITLGAANLAVTTLGLVATIFPSSGPDVAHQLADLWFCAGVGLAIASLAAAAQGGTRIRVGALIVALAVMGGSWAWYRVALPPKPEPTLADLKQTPEAQLIYPGAAVATHPARESESNWDGDHPFPAVLSRDEATNDNWPQVLAWFNQRLSTDGWTRDNTATASTIGQIALTWAWTKGNETFTLSIYSEAGRDASYEQAPELRGHTIAFDTSLN